MPYLKLKTNQTISESQQQELLSELSSMLASVLGKSEKYVMVELEAEKVMLFAATTEKLAYVECKSIGLTSQQAKDLSPEISQQLDAILGIPASRIYIEFSQAPAEFWGWNGSTFA